MHVKNYFLWSKVKEEINNRIVKTYLRSGEVRWFHCGINVGNEIDGHGERFLRPGLILHTVSNLFAFIVPITSTVKNVSGRIPFEHGSRIDSLCIDQIRIVSQKRILGRLLRLPKQRLLEIKRQVREFYDL